MALRADILDLVRRHGIEPTPAIARSLDDLLALVADENPDVPPLEREDDDDSDEAGLAVRTISCPHCGEPVVVELELDGGDQETVQDCSVCCRPIQLTWSTSDGRLDRFEVRAG
jgi:hypothetical protein